MTTLQKIKNLGFDDNKLKLDKINFYEKNNELDVVFVYPETAPLSQEDKDNITNTIKNDVNNLCKTVVKFNKSCFDIDVIYNVVEQFINTNYKVLKNELKKDDVIIEEVKNGAKITFLCDELRKQLLITRNFDKELIDFLSKKFFINFEIAFEVAKEAPDYQELVNDMPRIDTGLTDALAEEARINKMVIDLGECFYGKYTANSPIFIKDINSDDKEFMVACTVSNLLVSTYMSRGRGETQPSEKKKVSFTLTDPSGSIEAVIFANDKDMKPLSIIEDGMSLAVGGMLSEFNDNRNIRVNSLSKCEILTKEMKYVYRKVNDDYYYVKPQPVYEVKQMDLFSLTDKASTYWDTHESVVVFDLETTGLDPKNCQIIEIGAVKILKGSIIETFQTLINPQIEIPEEITALTHISNDMIEDAPTIEQALPDFYRFAYGSVLSAYNIDFDYQFLNNMGKKLRLLFDNQQIDTLKLARDKVPSLSNYKLGTVVKALNITLDNAHRALADAYATAKVFVKLI